MTSTTTLPRTAHRRGTRGFAAFVTLLAGFVVLGVGAVVLPATALSSLALSWLVPLTIAFAIAHFVAAYGQIRGRTWSASLTGYLAAIGLGIVSYGLLLVVTDLDPFKLTSSLPAAKASAQGIGLLLWMAGTWIVAYRFAWKGVEGRRAFANRSSVAAGRVTGLAAA
jgi:hypothetical protein